MPETQELTQEIRVYKTPRSQENEDGFWYLAIRPALHESQKELLLQQFSLRFLEIAPRVESPYSESILFAHDPVELEVEIAEPVESSENEAVADENIFAGLEIDEGELDDETLAALGAVASKLDHDDPVEDDPVELEVEIAEGNPWDDEVSDENALLAATLVGEFLDAEGFSVKVAEQIFLHSGKRSQPYLFADA